MGGAHETTDLSGHLLCAVPQLMDPNFRRSVVFMLEHNDTGAFGLVINSETDTPLKDVADTLKLEWQGEGGAVVRSGGPVDPERGWILHDQTDWDPASTELLSGLNLTTSLEELIEAGHERFGEDGQHFLFLFGYAGWGARQLESEIAAGSWVVVPVGGSSKDTGVDPNWLFEADIDEMWEGALRSIGVDPRRLVGLQGGGGALH